MPRTPDRLDAGTSKDTLPTHRRVDVGGDQPWKLVEAFQRSRRASACQGLASPPDDDLMSIVGKAAGGLAIILDNAGRVVWLSPGCELATGFRCDEWEGLSLHYSPLTTPSGDSFGMLDGGSPTGIATWTYESRWIAKDGSHLRIIWSLSTLRDEQGMARYVVGTGVDVSQRPGNQESSRQEELRLNSLLEISQKAADLSERQIIQHTLEEVVRLTQSEIGYLHFVNQDEESIELFAWSEGALRQCTAVSDSHYPISEAGVWADCARTKRPVVHNAYQDLAQRKGCPAGHLHLIRHASIPIVDAGKVVIILGVGNKATQYDDSDIRQMILAADSLWKIILRKRAEERLREHIAALEDADRQKDEFLGMLRTSCATRWRRSVPHWRSWTSRRRMRPSQRRPVA